MGQILARKSPAIRLFLKTKTNQAPAKGATEIPHVSAAFSPGSGHLGRTGHRPGRRRFALPVEALNYIIPEPEENTSAVQTERYLTRRPTSGHGAACPRSREEQDQDEVNYTAGKGKLEVYIADTKLDLRSWSWRSHMS